MHVSGINNLKYSVPQYDWHLFLKLVKTKNKNSWLMLKKSKQLKFTLSEQKGELLCYTPKGITYNLL